VRLQTEHLWLGLGLLGQALFSARFLVQWIASERKAKRSPCAVLVLLGCRQHPPAGLRGLSAGPCVHTWTGPWPDHLRAQPLLHSPRPASDVNRPRVRPAFHHGAAANSRPGDPPPPTPWSRYRAYARAKPYHNPSAGWCRSTGVVACARLPAGRRVIVRAGRLGTPMCAGCSSWRSADSVGERER
jgi:hypothetical protein